MCGRIFIFGVLEARTSAKNKGLGGIQSLGRKGKIWSSCCSDLERKVSHGDQKAFGGLVLLNWEITSLY